MTERASRAAPVLPPRLATSALTRLGLLLVLAGWALLIGGPFVRRLPPPFRPEDWLPSALQGTAVAQMSVLTGLGLAILGALRTGFQALNTFFAAVLQRSATPPRPEPARQRPEPAAPQPDVAPPQPEPVRIAERGRLHGRPYIAFSDGSAEVETLLGRRRFASLAEARDFVGS